MSPIIKKATIGNTWFWILSGFSIALITAGFIVPPTGVIDPGVLVGVGEIFAFAALGAVIKAIDMGMSAKVQHNNTSLTVGDDKRHKEEQR